MKPVAETRDWVAVNIHDVAAAAGVSITTVSHVLSDQGRVAESTKIRVIDAATRLGYQANTHARQLVTRKSRIIAIQMPKSPDTAECAVIPNSDYFLEVLNGAAEAASAESYALIVTPPEASLAAVNAFGIDGAILVDPLGDEDLFSVKGDVRRRIVTTGRPIHPRRRVRVVVDNDLPASARQMMDHLAANGYKRPALITTETTRSYTADLVAGYRDWCAEHGVRPVVSEGPEPPTPESAAATFNHLMRRKTRPDAIYTSSEDLALGVLHEANRLGITIPDELGLCSAVDSGSLQLTSPNITGMFVQPREVGRRAARALIRIIEGERVRDSHIEVPVQLNVRASTLRTST
jgi:DNA-binding LacI/PurR family transcriptional regulator